MTPEPIFNVPLSELKRRRSMKWTRYPADVIPAWVAEMDCRLPGPVQQALIEAVETGDLGYPDRPRYVESLQRFFAGRLGWDVAADRMRTVGDVMTGINFLIHLLSEPGDTVVLGPPVYAPFYEVIQDTGRRVGHAPLGEDGRLDLDAVEQAFAAGASVYLLSNPHNPTGAVHTPEELTALADLSQRYGVWVIADEIHAPLVLPGARFTPFLTVPGATRAVSVLSPSKAYGLAGVKAAVIVLGDEALPVSQAWSGNISGGVSHLGVLAHVAAMDHCGDWLDRLLWELDANRRLVGDLLARHLPAVRYRMPQATYLGWLDCRGLNLDRPAADVFLDGGVALSAGQAFGKDWGHHARINYATSPQILTEIVERMAATVA